MAGKAKKDSVRESLEFAKQLRAKSGDTMKAITPEAHRRVDEKRAARQAASKAAASSPAARQADRDRVMDKLNTAGLRGRREGIDKMLGKGKKK